MISFNTCNIVKHDTSGHVPNFIQPFSISFQTDMIYRCTFEKQEIKILLFDMFYTNDDVIVIHTFILTK